MRQPWWRVDLVGVFPDARLLVGVVLALTAVQSGLRVAASPGAFRDLGVAVGCAALLVGAPAVLLLADRVPLLRSWPVVAAVLACLLAVDVVVMVQLSGTGVYGRGLFTATGVGLACIALLLVRPVGLVVAAGAVHGALVLAGALVHPSAMSWPVDLALGVEVAAASVVPVAAATTYLLLVARMSQVQRVADRARAHEEAQRVASVRVAEAERRHLEVVRSGAGPLLREVVDGAALPLAPDAAAQAADLSRRLREQIVAGGRRTWLDEGLHGEAPDGTRVTPAPLRVVDATGGSDDVPVGARPALLALLRRLRLLGTEVSVTLVADGAVVGVRGAGALEGDVVVEQLRRDAGAPAWIDQGDLLVLEVGDAPSPSTDSSTAPSSTRVHPRVDPRGRPW